MAPQSKKHSSRKAVAVGAGIAAITGLAYMFFGPDGKKNRSRVHGWAVTMTGEILEKLEEAKEITEPVYHHVIDEVAKKYAALKTINKEDLRHAVSEIRKQWRHMEQKAKSITKQ